MPCEAAQHHTMAVIFDFALAASLATREVHLIPNMERPNAIITTSESGQARLVAGF